jgi:hypothetical protein
MTTTEMIKLFVAVIIFAIVIAIVAVLGRIDAAQTIQIIITFVLVLVTVAYVKRTAEIASATREQANASLKMAEEMREQRITSSRPVVIQKPIVETQTELATFGSKDWFSYFEVYNAGNGPAIELEVSLLDKDKNQIASHRITFLRASDLPIRWPDPFRKEFSIDLASREESLYYFVSEYQGILSGGPTTKWYQTWLPFETIKTSQKGKIFVKPGQLEFKEVVEKERIDAFGSRSKPK